jgi:hypothetical protein
MLRREADGATWTANRIRAHGGTLRPRTLNGYWVTGGDPGAAGDLLTALIPLVERSTPGLADPAARLHVTIADGMRVGSRPWTDRIEAVLDDALVRDQPRVIMTWRADASLSVDRRVPGGAWDWELRALIDPEALDRTAEAWATLLTRVARTGDLLGGGVYFDRYTSMQTPHEAYLAIPDGLETAPRHPRHYCWTNALTAQHIAGLGGPDEVVRRAERHGLRASAVDGVPPGTVMTVEDPGPISAFDDKRLAAMKAFLDPVLRQEPYWWYSGQPLHVVKEPGTAFRPIPVDIREPWFDDDPPLDENSAPAARLVPDEP